MAFSLANRNKSILERRFIDQVLDQEGQNIVDAQSQIDNQFVFEAKSVRRGRGYSVGGNKLELQHSMIQRFFDMKKLRGRPQKSSRQHNAVIWGHFNNINGKIQFGYTQAAIEAMKNEIKIEVNG